MRPESPAFIWDARRAAGLIQQFVSGHDLTDYLGDPLLRSGVERQFEIIGESLNKLNRIDPDVAAVVPDLPKIVAFRNVLVHGYATIDSEIVWEVVSTRVSRLIDTLDRLLDGVGDR